MRWAVAAFILYAVCPLYAGTKGSFYQDYAEQLIWEGRLGEAAEYSELLANEGYYNPVRLSCLAYGLAGDIDQARHYCDSAYTPFRTMDMSHTAEVLAMMALTEWRAGSIAPGLLDRALNWHKQPRRWLVQMVSIALRTPEHQQIDAARTLCTQLDETNQPRCRLAFAAIFPEHAKTIRERHAAEDAAKAQAHRRRRFMTAVAVISAVLLTAVGAYHQRARIIAFLSTPSRPTAAAPQPVATPGYPTPYPANWQAWQAGYMNRAYQIAAYSWVTVWLLVCLPIVALLAIPAISILADFSASGFQSGIARAKGFAGGFLGWGRLWFALLLLSLTVFAVTKIYGRYSLPKPFRPRIRVIRTTIRLSIFAVALVSVGTLLTYFSGVALNLYSNPMVRFIIEFLRKTLGF